MSLFFQIPYSAVKTDIVEYILRFWSTLRLNGVLSSVHNDGQVEP